MTTPNESFRTTLERYMLSPAALSIFDDLSAADHVDLITIHDKLSDLVERDPDAGSDLIMMVIIAATVTKVATTHKHKQFCPMCFALGLQDFVDGCSALASLVDGAPTAAGVH